MSRLYSAPASSRSLNSSFGLKPPIPQTLSQRRLLGSSSSFRQAFKIAVSPRSDRFPHGLADVPPRSMGGRRSAPGRKARQCVSAHSPVRPWLAVLGETSVPLHRIRAVSVREWAAAKCSASECAPDAYKRRHRREYVRRGEETASGAETARRPRRRQTPEPGGPVFLIAIKIGWTLVCPTNRPAGRRRIRQSGHATIADKNAVLPPISRLSARDAQMRSVPAVSRPRSTNRKKNHLHGAPGLLPRHGRNYDAPRTDHRLGYRSRENP